MVEEENELEELIWDAIYASEEGRSEHSTLILVKTRLCPPCRMLESVQKAE